MMPCLRKLRGTSFVSHVPMTAIVGLVVELVVSTLVNSADKTMPLLVLITMAQLVLSGGLIPVAGKAGLEQVDQIE